MARRDARKESGPAKPRSKGDQAFRFCMTVFWIGIAASVVLVSVWTWHAGPGVVQRGLEAARPYLAAWRLLLFLILIGGWRVWLGLFARWAALDERQYRFALAWRWRMAAWLVVIEVLLVQGVMGKFIVNLLGLG